ncbi:MAG: prevent-host-death protein [Acidimicrobiia bacterium]
MKTHYTSSDARSHIRDVLDAAADGIPQRVQRESTGFVVVSEDLFARVLSRSAAVPTPQVYAENDGWTLILPGVPVAADAGKFNDAVDDFIDAVREYADDWIADARLRQSPSHRENAPLVHFVHSSTDEDLRDWVAGVGGSALAGSVEPETI